MNHLLFPISVFSVPLWQLGIVPRRCRRSSGALIRGSIPAHAFTLSRHETVGRSNYSARVFEPHSNESSYYAGEGESRGLMRARRGQGAGQAMILDGARRLAPTARPASWDLRPVVGDCSFSATGTIYCAPTCPSFNYQTMRLSNYQTARPSLTSSPLACTICACGSA